MPLTHMLPLAIFTPPLHRHSRQSSLTVARRAVDLRTIDEGFGLPSSEDPDPFGVLALRQAGLAIKEAGSQQRASSDAFEYRPSPTSPAFRLSLQSASGDGPSRRDSRRNSKRSVMSDQGTQTAELPGSPEGEESAAMREENVPVLQPSSPVARPSSPVARPSSPVAKPGSPVAQASNTPAEPAVAVATPAPAYHSPIHDPWKDADPRPAVIAATELVHSPATEEPAAPLPAPTTHAAIATAAPYETAAPIPILSEAVQSPIVTRVTRAKLVTIRGRPAPALPSRNPLRAVRPQVVHAASDETTLRDGDGDGDDSSSEYSISPTRSGFDGDDDEDAATQPWSEQTSIVDTESVRLKTDGASRQGSLDERKGSQDAGHPLSREVGGEWTRSGAESPRSREGLEVGRTNEEEVPKDEDAELPKDEDSEAQKDEDEFHSAPPSPVATSSPYTTISIAT